MTRRTLNLHVSEGAHAWLKAFGQAHAMTMSEAVRCMIRDSMRSELAEAGIAAGMRCARQDCQMRPAKHGYCEAHGEPTKQQRRKRT